MLQNSVLTVCQTAIDSELLKVIIWLEESACFLRLPYCIDIPTSEKKEYKILRQPYFLQISARTVESALQKATVPPKLTAVGRKRQTVFFHISKLSFFLSS